MLVLICVIAVLHSIAQTAVNVLSLRRVYLQSGRAIFDALREFAIRCVWIHNSVRTIIEYIDSLTWISECFLATPCAKFAAYAASFLAEIQNTG